MEGGWMMALAFGLLSFVFALPSSNYCGEKGGDFVEGLSLAGLLDAAIGITTLGGWERAENGWLTD
jgi:hypothetical protein